MNELIVCRSELCRDSREQYTGFQSVAGGHLLGGPRAKAILFIFKGITHTNRPILVVREQRLSFLFLRV